MTCESPHQSRRRASAGCDYLTPAALSTRGSTIRTSRHAPGWCRSWRSRSGAAWSACWLAGSRSPRRAERMPREGPGRGRRDGRRRGLHQRPGPAAPRRDGTAVRRGARPVDVGDVPAAVHLRARPPARRRGRRSAGPARGRDTGSARRSQDGVRRSRRHRAPDLRLRQAGRRTRLHRRQRAQRAARGHFHSAVRTPDRGHPAPAGVGQLRPRRGEAAGRRPGHGTAGGCGRAGAGARTRPTTATTSSRPVAAPAPGSRSPPASPLGGQGDHRHR